MARARKTTASRKRRGGGKVSIDFSQKVLDFEGDMEYAVEVKEATLEEGEKAPYIAFVFKGADEEFSETTVYHNASTAPRALSRTQSLLEALGLEVPDDGTLDLDVTELPGLKCMAHTFFEKDQNGTPRIRFDDFWPLDEDGNGGSKSSGGDGDAIDYEGLSDADIKKLAKAMKIKGRDADKLREELAEEDQDEVREAAEELDIELEAAEDPEPEEKPARKKRGAKKDEDEEEDEEEEKPKRGRGAGKRGSAKSKKKQTWTEDEIDEMSEDELETVIEEAELEVDLDDHKTLRKKKNAVIDELTEKELLED